MAKVERGKAVSRVWCWGSREGQVSGRREGFLLLGGDQGRDREAPVGFDHVQLVGPVQEQSEWSGSQLEKAEESGGGGLST